jgi:hypothetical protein
MLRRIVLHSAIALLWLSSIARAQAESITPKCSTNPLVEQRVRIAYPSLPSDASSTTLSIPLLMATLVSSSDDPLAYEIVGELTAAGQRTELVLATGSLTPHETWTLAVPLDAFGIDISNLQFSGRLSLDLRVRDAAGTLLDLDTAPPVYFHETSGTGDGPSIVHVYRSEARRVSFNAGDLHHTLFSTPPARLLGAFEGGGGRGLPSEDHGQLLSGGGASGGPDKIGIGAQRFDSDRWQFCLRWVYDSIDSGFGEDYYTSGRLMSARGARIEISHPSWLEPKSFYANKDTGCVEFNAPENSGFVVKIWAETRLGDNNNIFIRAYPTKLEAALNPTEPPYWEFTADPFGVPRTVYYQNELSPVSNLIAFSSFIFDRVDSQCAPGLPGPENLRVVNDNPDCDVGGSCQDNNYVEIAAGATNRKFLVGHEVGHWIHYQWVSGDTGFVQQSWSANSGDADCAFVGVGDHAMRSKEYSAGAFGEGLAHFLSALAWNSSASTTAWFKYYKEALDPAYADFAADNWRLDIEGLGLAPSGGVSNWMSNMCSVTDGHSVEMDWMRFYWDYLTNAGAPKPTIRHILRHVQFTRDAHAWIQSALLAYDRHLDAIQDPLLNQTQFEVRFTSLAASNGIAQ